MADDGWKKKYKGSERGGANIYIHPDAKRAIVHNHLGITWAGQRYETLAEAKAAALGQGLAFAKRQRAKPARHAANVKEGAASFADALKNVRRTATRRLDEAGVPDDKQGNTEGDW